MFKTRIAHILVLGLALSIALAGPISQASADNGPGGDNYNHYVWATCSYHSISVDIQASGTFNGQVVTTRVWARVNRRVMRLSHPCSLRGVWTAAPAKFVGFHVSYVAWRS